MTDSNTCIAKMAQNLQNLTQTQRKLNTNSYTSKVTKHRLNTNSKQFQLNMKQKIHILNANLTQINIEVTYILYKTQHDLTQFFTNFLQT